MKNVVLLIIAFFMSLTVNAQYRDVKLPQAPKQTKYRNYDLIDKGAWFAVEAEGGSSIMGENKNMQYASLAFTSGYRISEFLRLGAGLGVRYYFNNGSVRGTSNKFGVPIFANARGNMLSAYDRDGVPFWSLNVGGITKEGFFLNPTIGYSFGGWRNNFLIGISYTLTTFKNESQKSMAYSYFGLKLGYEF